ncbi:REST corepressor 3 isoform X1 [Lates japonicus]|uniref:REST corepressor 3 isoform X1 n=1 Tax=Lates japonicus TaxID=270547 RepID=A0AAD3N8D7_LATJO|nr:REST corepressor 3 isoform X1 [Lates japonicus]
MTSNSLTVVCLEAGPYKFSQASQNLNYSSKTHTENKDQQPQAPQQQSPHCRSAVRKNLPRGERVKRGGSLRRERYSDTDELRRASEQRQKKNLQLLLTFYIPTQRLKTVGKLSEEMPGMMDKGSVGQTIAITKEETWIQNGAGSRHALLAQTQHRSLWLTCELHPVPGSGPGGGQVLFEQAFRPRKETRIQQMLRTIHLSLVKYLLFLEEDSNSRTSLTRQARRLANRNQWADGAGSAGGSGSAGEHQTAAPTPPAFAAAPKGHVHSPGRRGGPCPAAPPPPYLLRQLDMELVSLKRQKVSSSMDNRAAPGIQVKNFFVNYGSGSTWKRCCRSGRRAGILRAPSGDSATSGEREKQLTTPSGRAQAKILRLWWRPFSLHQPPPLWPSQPASPPPPSPAPSTASSLPAARPHTLQPPPLIRPSNPLPPRLNPRPPAPMTLGGNPGGSGPSSTQQPSGLAIHQSETASSSSLH